jgi:hypothetical protein
MNTSPDKRSRFPFFRRVFRALFGRKGLFVLIALVTFVALFYAEENFRGKRAWERYRKEAEARGAVLDFIATVPPEIPAAENAANTRFIQSWFAVGRGSETNPLAQVYSNLWPRTFEKVYSRNFLPKQFRGKGQDDRHLTDLVVWKKAFTILGTNGSFKSDDNDSELIAQIPRDPTAQPAAARAVLEALKGYQDAISELRVAAHKPRVRYPVVYKNDDPFSILLPHLARIKGVAQVLKIEASAKLAMGQSDAAFDDVRLMLWLCDSLENETFIISQLVRIACLQLASVPIWEGLVDHKWSDTQLKGIEERMLRINLAAEMDRSIEGERAASIAFAQNVIKRNNLGQTLEQLDSWEGGTPTPVVWKRFLGSLVPRGWIHFEMVNHSTLLDGLVDGGWDSRHKVFHLQQVGSNEEEFKFHLELGWKAILHHQVLANLTLPALTKASVRYARGQNTANQIALACAIERYRIANGTFPEKLAALVPQFIPAIPNEAVSPSPMRYSRKENGYVLYSAGWDGRDDRGAMAAPAKQNAPEKGDWVWRIPPQVE